MDGVCFLATSGSAGTESARDDTREEKRRGDERRARGGEVEREEEAEYGDVVGNCDVERVTHGPCRPRLLSSREHQESWKFTKDENRSRERRTVRTRANEKDSG